MMQLEELLAGDSIIRRDTETSFEEEEPVLELVERIPGTASPFGREVQ